MRSLGLSLIAALGLMTTTAVAQNYLPGNYPPPPETQPGTPPGTNPATGARPGNVIGTGSSLPRSNRASNITPSDTRSSVAPNLPSPPIGENASPRAYLIAARGALAAGRTGEAQQSLEMAQTRLLDRSVPLFQTNTPPATPPSIRSRRLCRPLVREIGRARCRSSTRPFRRWRISAQRSENHGGVSIGATVAFQRGRVGCNDSGGQLVPAMPGLTPQPPGRRLGCSANGPRRGRNRRISMKRLLLLGFVLSVAACNNPNRPTDTGSMAFPPPAPGSSVAVPGNQVPPPTGGMAIQQPGSTMTRQGPTQTDTGSMTIPPASGGTTRQAYLIRAASVAMRGSSPRMTTG